QFQNFLFAARLSQVGSVQADHIEPSFVQELTQSRCARTSVLRVWIAVGFNADDLLDDGVNRRYSARFFALRLRCPIRGGRTKPGENTPDQEQPRDDQRQHPTVAMQVPSEIHCRVGLIKLDVKITFAKYGVWRLVPKSIPRFQDRLVRSPS